MDMCPKRSFLAFIRQRQIEERFVPVFGRPVTFGVFLAGLGDGGEDGLVGCLVGDDEGVN